MICKVVCVTFLHRSIEIVYRMQEFVFAYNNEYRIVGVYGSTLAYVLVLS